MHCNMSDGIDDVKTFISGGIITVQQLLHTWNVNVYTSWDETHPAAVRWDAPLFSSSKYKTHITYRIYIYVIIHNHVYIYIYRANKKNKHNVTLCVEHSSIRISLFPDAEILNFWVWWNCFRTGAAMEHMQTSPITAMANLKSNTSWWFQPIEE